MKMTVGELVRKLSAIEDAIDEIQSKIDNHCLDSLEDAATFLAEYAAMIRSIEIDI